MPPASEQALGLGAYATASEGVAGTLKARPEDFAVGEVSLYPRPEAEGPYVVLRIRSRNWEQHELGQRLASRLGLPTFSIRWAGTKDRRAVAERLASYKGPLPSGPIDLPGVEVLEAYRAAEGLSLGHHFGNAFDLVLRDVDAHLGAERLPRTLQELRAFGGIPNYFGPQRFGEVRPVTHRVGRALVRGDVAAAVDLYLTDLTEGADPRGLEARRAYAEHRDPARALREFPPEFRFERQLLDHLARGNPPGRALRALPRELRQLFVHAYQSLIFNRFLTARLSDGSDLATPEPGDMLLRVARDGTVPGDAPVPVALDNLPEARESVERGRAVVAGPLPGTRTPRADGPPGDLLDRLLAEEGVTRADFALRAIPELASEGVWRPLRLPMPPIDLRPEPTEIAPGTAWRFRFTLPRGAYATVVLREFRKEGATPAPPEGPRDGS